MPFPWHVATRFRESSIVLRVNLLSKRSRLFQAASIAVAAKTVNSGNSSNA